MEDTADEEDQNTNPKLTEKFIFRSEYVSYIESTNRNFDYINATALKNTKAYESCFNKINILFPFLTPTERDLHCSPEIMLRTKLTHRYK